MRAMPVVMGYILVQDRLQVPWPGDQHPLGDLGPGCAYPVLGVSVEAEGHFGWMVPFALLDSPASSALTRKRFGRQPEHRGLLADLDEATTSPIDAPSTLKGGIQSGPSHAALAD